MEAAPEPGVGFAGAAPTAASSCPASCPRSTPPRRSCKLLDLLAPRADARCRRSSTALPPVHIAHETVVDAVGAEGHGDARRWSSTRKDRERRARRRREGPATTTAGRWRCPTRRSRSPTCGPRADRRRGPPARPGVRPAHPPAAALSPALARASTRQRSTGRRSGSVRRHERPRRLRYSTDHEWVRVDGRPGRASASPTSRRTRSVTSCSSQLPEVGADGRGRASRSARSSRRSRCPTSTRRCRARSSR